MENWPSSKARVPATKCSRGWAVSSANARAGASNVRPARKAAARLGLNIRALLHQTGGASPDGVAEESYKRSEWLERSADDRDAEADRERVPVGVVAVGLVDRAVVAEQLHVGSEDV